VLVFYLVLFVSVLFIIWSLYYVTDILSPVVPSLKRLFSVYNSLLKQVRVFKFYKIGMIENIYKQYTIIKNYIKSRF